MKGKALVSDGKELTLQEVLIREPQEDEVLVKMAGSGVCQTDINRMNQLDVPFIPGHEGSGWVVSSGKEVKDLNKGQQVVLNWASPCGICNFCQNRQENLCRNNSPIVGRHKNFDPHFKTTFRNDQAIPRLFNLGTFAQHCLVKRSSLTPVNTNHTLAPLSILGCAVLTGYGSVKHYSRVGQGSSVVVIGCGGVGINVIESCNDLGASPIIAIDINQNKLNKASLHGATHLINCYDDVDLKSSQKEVWNLSQNRGADQCFECTGIPSMAFAPLQMIRNGGEAIQISGVEETLEVDMNWFEFDKTYVNPLYGGCRPSVDIPELMDKVNGNKLQLENQISHSFRLEEYRQLFDLIEKGVVTKGLLTMAD